MVKIGKEKDVMYQLTFRIFLPIARREILIMLTGSSSDSGSLLTLPSQD